MVPVLHLDPVLGPAALVRPIAMLRNKFAGLPKKIRPDLALLELADEDAVRPASQEALQIHLAH